MRQQLTDGDRLRASLVAHSLYSLDPIGDPVEECVEAVNAIRERDGEWAATAFVQAIVAESKEITARIRELLKLRHVQ